MPSIELDDFTVETNQGDDASLRASLGMPEAEETSPDGGSKPDRLGDAGVATGAAGDASSEAAGDVQSADGSDVSEPAEDEKPTKEAKPRHSMQARLSQETARRKALEEKAARLEAELTTFKTSAASTGPAVPPAAPQPSALPGTRPKPTSEDVGAKYPTYEAFVEDLTDWKAEQRDLAREWKEKAAAYEAREAAGREKYPDYDAALKTGNELLVKSGTLLSEAVMRAIVESESSADVVYWLATHPAELLQLARDTSRLDVSAASVVRQLLETRVGAGARSGSALPAVSNAKPPIRPVGASPVTALADESDEIPFDDWFARENVKARKRGQR